MYMGATTPLESPVHGFCGDAQPLCMLAIAEFLYNSPYICHRNMHDYLLGMKGRRCCTDGQATPNVRCRFWTLHCMSAS